MPEQPAGAVLILHGGASRRTTMVSPAQLSVLRMIPIARRIARLAKGRLAIFRLLNSRRGWDTSHTPVDDVRWALATVAARLHPTRPTGLIGHSLGARAAILAADQQEVRSVVALAPWVHPTDVPSRIPAARFLFVHGSLDRVASPARSAMLARRLSRTAHVGYITVEGGRHAMLKRHALFDGLAAEFTAATLLDTPLSGSLARVAGGERQLRV
ncbi:MAG TPA: alpha/beta fold hydrolase [Solirubrobacteraceae bacterium]|nr:alpha/beta fold hydrolase [Solirubrobacteraceae bacterium]